MPDAFDHELSRAASGSIDVVTAVATLGSEARLGSIAYQSGYAKSTVHEWLLILVQDGVLARDEETNSTGQVTHVYRLGPVGLGLRNLLSGI